MSRGRGHHEAWRSGCCGGARARGPGARPCEVFTGQWALAGSWRAHVRHLDPRGETGLSGDGCLRAQTLPGTQALPDPGKSPLRLPVGHGHSEGMLESPWVKQVTLWGGHPLSALCCLYPPPTGCQGRCPGLAPSGGWEAVYTISLLREHTHRVTPSSQ